MGVNENIRDSMVRVGPLTNIPALLHELGFDPSGIFARSELDRDVLENPNNKIPYRTGGELLSDCLVTTQCESFGLRLGLMANTSHLGLAGFMTQTARTVGHALDALVNNLDLHDQGGVCVLRSNENYSRLSFHIHQPGVRAIEQIYDLSAVILCKIMRSLCGNDWIASEVTLVRTKPKNLVPYKRYFRTAMVFNSAESSILFPEHLLEKVPPSSDELLFHHLEMEADALHQMQHLELVDRLPAMLQSGLLVGRFSANDIANELGINVRTLHRRLTSAGTSYRREVDKVRRSASLQLLENTSLSIHDIATTLGYADSSGFDRAFHRWVGCSPLSWRKQNQ